MHNFFFYYFILFDTLHEENTSKYMAKSTRRQVEQKNKANIKY